MRQAVIQHGDDSGLRLIVHLPTTTGRTHKSRLARTPAHPLLARDGLRPLTITTEDGTLRAEVREILHMARDLPIVVSTGHADGREVRLLVEEGARVVATDLPFLTDDAAALRSYLQRFGTGTPAVLRQRAAAAAHRLGLTPEEIG